LPAAAIIAVTVDNVMSLSAEARMLLAMLTILRGYDGLAILEKYHRPQLPRMLTGSCQKPLPLTGTTGPTAATYATPRELP
jgi:hypothetical protein